MDETKTHSATAAQANGAQSGAAVDQQRQGSDQPQDRIAELESALEAAKAEAAANWEKYLRERADAENYKKRIERTYADLAKRGRKELILKFLGAVDNLERAVAYQEDSTQEVDARNLVKGLKMTYLQFKELLASEGLTEIKTVGEQFDPTLHEAIATEPAEGRKDGEIIAEIQKGYTIGEELLRPARVKVASSQ